MSNVHTVHVMQSFHQKFKYFLTVFLTYFSIRLSFKIRSKRNPRQILHDNIQMIIGFHYINDFNNIWMIKHFQNLNFPSDWFLPLRIIDFAFLINFDSNFLILYFMHGHSDRSIGSLANNLSNKIIPFELSCKINIHIICWGKEILNSVLFLENLGHSCQKFIVFASNLKEFYAFIEISINFQYWFVFILSIFWTTTIDIFFSVT